MSRAAIQFSLGCDAREDGLCRYCWQPPRAVGDCPRLGLARGQDFAAPSPLGLGDAVAWLLGLIGITSPRYIRFKRALGLSRGCDCGGRRRRWNELGRRIAAWISRRAV